MILAWACALAASAQTQTLRVAATGDIMLGTDYPENRLPDDDGAGFLAAVAPEIQAADIAIGNLEGVVLSGGEPAKTCTNPDACFLFRSPPRYAGLLRDAGYDVLSLANNHARDFGEDGRTATMAVLDDYGLRHSGRRGDIASWTHDGLRLAFIAFSPTRQSYLLNDIPTAVEEVAALAVDHDIVIVSFHGGAEGPAAMELPFEEEFYFGETRGEVVRFARAVIDVGADLVLGHGPHVPRAMELYRDRLVAYSLGNFATYYGVSVAGVAGVAPLLVADLGLSAIWFGVFLVRAMEIGFVHPPIGMNLYVIQGVAPEVSLGRIFKGVLPFLAADLLHLVLLVVFPVIVLGLPEWLGR